MTLLRFLIAVASLASAAMLTGCPGKSSQSNAAPHDAAYYNAHPQERQATLERCGKLDQSAQASDEDCKAALYSSLYGPSQLRPTATP